MTSLQSTLQRSAFTTSRSMEFFTQKELMMQIGHRAYLWPLALLKELIDNALDACETAGITPQVSITLEADMVSIHDNGPGLPEAVLERSLDYLVRVSDKAHYCAPTRGQLGNALKCVWAAPFVLDGKQGCVEVSMGGKTHHIEVSLDRIRQQPQMQHTIEEDGVVKTGTLFRLYWPRIASYLCDEGSASFYNAGSLAVLLRNYHAFNPHASFILCEENQRYEFQPSCEFLPSDTAWKKWLPTNPTSPHWYTRERLRSLIAAYVSEEQQTGRSRSVREFVSEFNGLSASAKQKDVTEACEMSGKMLHDLVCDNDIDRAAVASLLRAMQTQARPVKPALLGILGEAHMRRIMQEEFLCAESVTYKKVEDFSNGLPFVLEVAFGIHAEAISSRQVAVGLNWSAVINIPIPTLDAMLGTALVQPDDGVSLIVHLACPRLEFTDRGKSTLALPQDIEDALQMCIETVTKKYTAQKRHADRQGRLQAKQLEELRKNNVPQHMSIKDAAFQVMEEAYMHTSGNNELPANARQVMYSVRTRILPLTGNKSWSDDSYFTQKILQQFFEDKPELTAEWDVVFDARGNFVEPHTKRGVDLGTLAVRGYVEGWHDAQAEEHNGVELASAVTTSGPQGRYQYVLFIEKEGFYPLLERAQIADRFDIAVMSTKGMSVTAARHLVEKLSEEGVTILVVRDFDKSGFSIAHTLSSDTRRYTFKTAPKVIDLGLRLTDVKEMDLQSEAVSYATEVDPRLNLRANGATEEEANFLVRRPSENKKEWLGERVELNAMTSPQFIAWLESKFAEHGVCKLVPDKATLEAAYRRACERKYIQEAMNKAFEEAKELSQDIAIPDDLGDQVEEAIADTADAWDDAIWNLAQANSEEVEDDLEEEVESEAETTENTEAE